MKEGFMNMRKYGLTDRFAALASMYQKWTVGRITL